MENMENLSALSNINVWNLLEVLPPQQRAQALAIVNSLDNQKKASDGRHNNVTNNNNAAIGNYGGTNTFSGTTIHYGQGQAPSQQQQQQQAQPQQNRGVALHRMDALDVLMQMMPPRRPQHANDANDAQAARRALPAAAPAAPAAREDIDMADAPNDAMRMQLFEVPNDPLQQAQAHEQEQEQKELNEDEADIDMDDADDDWQDMDLELDDDDSKALLLNNPCDDDDDINVIVGPAHDIQRVPRSDAVVPQVPQTAAAAGAAGAAGLGAAAAGGNSLKLQGDREDACTQKRAQNNTNGCISNLEECILYMEEFEKQWSGTTQGALCYANETKGGRRQTRRYIHKFTNPNDIKNVEDLEALLKNVVELPEKQFKDVMNNDNNIRNLCICGYRSMCRTNSTILKTLFKMAPKYHNDNMFDYYQNCVKFANVYNEYESMLPQKIERLKRQNGWMNQAQAGMTGMAGLDAKDTNEEQKHQKQKQKQMMMREAGSAGSAGSGDNEFEKRRNDKNDRNNRKERGSKKSEESDERMSDNKKGPKKKQSTIHDFFKVKR